MNILHSRKFQALVLDTVLSLSLYFTGKYASPDLAEDVKIMIGLLQPIFIAYIMGVAKEDAAAKAAGTFVGREQK